MRVLSFILGIYVCQLTNAATANGTVNGTDDWVSIEQTDIYRDLDTCAQECVLNVNSKVWDEGQSRFCQSQGCVCSDSTRGPNFVNAESNVTSCVAKACGRDDAVERARLAINNLCLVLSINKTQPRRAQGTVLRITSAGYPNITSCAKFVLNGCRDETGERNEPQCGPVKQPEYWEDYRGVAAQQQCMDEECICRGPYFDVSAGLAYNAGIKYCAMWPSTKEVPNPVVDDMLRVIATFCTSAGYPPQNYTIQYSGSPPGSKDNDKKDWIQLGVGVACSVLALLVGGFFNYLVYRVSKLTKEAPSGKKKS